MVTCHITRTQPDGQNMTSISSCSGRLLGRLTHLLDREGDQWQHSDCLTEFANGYVHAILCIHFLSTPDARVRFRYDWLRQDPERIRTGIRDHIEASRNAPRNVAPLRGDYR